MSKISQASKKQSSQPSGPPPPPAPRSLSEERTEALAATKASSSVSSLPAAASVATKEVEVSGAAASVAAAEKSGKSSSKASKKGQWSAADESKRTSMAFVNGMKKGEATLGIIDELIDGDLQLVAYVLRLHEQMKNMESKDIEHEIKLITDNFMANKSISNNAKTLFKAILSGASSSSSSSGDDDTTSMETEGQIMKRLFLEMCEKKGFKAQYLEDPNDKFLILDVLGHFLKVVKNVSQEDIQSELEKAQTVIVQERRAAIEERKKAALLEADSMDKEIEEAKAKAEEAKAKAEEARIALEKLVAKKETRKRKAGEISESEDAFVTKMIKGRDAIRDVCGEDASLIEEFNGAEQCIAGRCMRKVLIVRKYTANGSS